MPRLKVREDVLGVININQHIGKILRDLRNGRGWSLEFVAEQIGCSFQQVFKYEEAQNRIPVETLWLLSKVYEVNIAYFFEGYEESGLGFVEEQTELDEVA